MGGNCSGFYILKPVKPNHPDIATTTWLQRHWFLLNLESKANQTITFNRNCGTETAGA